MKRLIPILAFAGGILVLALLIPRYNAVQPHVRITRGEAQSIADREAVKLGIPVDKSWTSMTWVGTPHLDRELEKDPERYRRAQDDPVIGPRLGGYHVVYYRRGLEKQNPYGYVYVGGKGELLAKRRMQRPETTGASKTEAELRPLADAYVRSRQFPGAPNPVFESARPNVLRGRTDWTFRYKVSTTFPIGNVVPYLQVYFTGDRIAGHALIEEYADGSPFRFESAIGGAFIGFGALYVLLLVLIVLFLRKYHAGEVGVGTSSLLFATMLLLTLAGEILIAPAAANDTGLGSIDAQTTAWAVAGFKFLFVHLPLAVLVYLAWAVGESYARERWGERLASFDAILRRDPINATVGRSFINGLLTAPAVAAASLLIGYIPIVLGLAWPVRGSGTSMILFLGGPIAVVLNSLVEAISAAVVSILFVLAFAHRRRVLALGLVIAAALMALGAIATPPIGPFTWLLVFGFGGGLAAILIFLRYDILTSAIALFFGSVIAAMLPLLSHAEGSLARQMIFTAAVPFVIAVGVGVAGLWTRREVVYSYEDLAPHVRRIVERERVKAEIDAANRIQAALLPLDAPNLAGASVSSHYRAASEIGGDYFDFLKLPNGDIGIAFGDVAGHGLTSGIVMAMAKSALMVQVDYDSSPRAVLDVLNDIVMKTAPKRMMMTFFFGQLDPRGQTLRFSSAGHLDPYVYRAEANRLEALSSWGFPLGVRRREPYREHVVNFQEGDRLILYSDGLIEAIDDDGDPFGFERFEQTILANGQATAEELKKALLAAVKKFTRNRPPEDDQTLVVVAFEELAADNVTDHSAVIALQTVEAAETVH